MSSLGNVASRVPKKPGNRQRGSRQLHETFTSQFLFSPCAEVGLPLKYEVRLRDPRERNHDPAHDMGTAVAVKDSRGDFPVGTLGCYTRLKKPDGKLLPGTFGLTCHHVVSKFASDVSLPSESRLGDHAPVPEGLSKHHLDLRTTKRESWARDSRHG